MKALLIIAHGSRVDDSAGVMERLASKLKGMGRYDLAEVAYVQFQQPGIGEAVARLVERGAKEIVAVPAFLFRGVHVTRDIPGELKVSKDAHPGVKIFLAEPIGYDERICEILAERAAGEVVEIS